MITWFPIIKSHTCGYSLAYDIEDGKEKSRMIFPHQWWIALQRCRCQAASKSNGTITITSIIKKLTLTKTRGEAAL